MWYNAEILLPPPDEFCVYTAQYSDTSLGPKIRIFEMGPHKLDGWSNTVNLAKVQGVVVDSPSSSVSMAYTASRFRASLDSSAGHCVALCKRSLCFQGVKNKGSQYIQLVQRQLSISETESEGLPEPGDRTAQRMFLMFTSTLIHVSRPSVDPRCPNNLDFPFPSPGMGTCVLGLRNNDMKFLGWIMSQ